MLINRGKQFLLPSGLTIQKHSLKEGYTCEPYDEDSWKFIVLMSAERMAEGLAQLFDALEYPGFLILETPASKKQEQELATQDTKFHKNIYFQDGLAKETAQAIYKEDRELLINDGMSRFGFGSHIQKEEVFVDQYKAIEIWTATPEKYQTMLEGMGLKQRPVLYTMADFIHPRNPCNRKSIQVNGMTVYDLVDSMLSKGLYLAKTTEE